MRIAFKDGKKTYLRYQIDESDMSERTFCFEVLIPLYGWLDFSIKDLAELPKKLDGDSNEIYHKRVYDFTVAHISKQAMFGFVVRVHANNAHMALKDFLEYVK